MGILEVIIIHYFTSMIKTHIIVIFTLKNSLSLYHWHSHFKTVMGTSWYSSKCLLQSFLFFFCVKQWRRWDWKEHKQFKDKLIAVLH